MKHLLIFFCVFAVSCTGKVNVHTDSIVKKDVPVYENGDFIYAYTSISETASRFNLDPLELGYDSLQIRIWYGYSRGDSSQVFILKRKDNRWQGSSIIMRNLIDNRDYSAYLSDTITCIHYHHSDLDKVAHQLL